MRILGKSELDLWGLTHELAFNILTSQRGIIISIDLRRLVNLLEGTELNIDVISLNVEVGQPFPLFEYYREGEFAGLLCTIRAKVERGKNTPNSVKDFRGKLRAIESSLRECFVIDEVTYTEVAKPIWDIFRFFELNLTESAERFDEVVEAVHVALELLSKESRTNGEGGFTLSDYSLHSFTHLLTRSLERDLTAEQFGKTMRLFYYLSDVAVKRGDLNVFKALLNGLARGMFVALTQTAGFHREVSNHILSLRELAFTRFWPRQRATGKEVTNDEKFLLSVARYATESAIISTTVLINHSYARRPSEMSIYLEKNLQTLIDFLPRHSETSIANSNEMKKLATNFAQDLVYLSAFMLLEALRGRFPVSFVPEFAFPLAQQAPTVHTSVSQGLLDDLFWDVLFNDPFDPPFGDLFEVEKLHKAGAYTPWLFNFSKFWLFLSIYRRKHDGEFIPAALPKGTTLSLDSQRGTIDGQLRAIDNQITAIEYHRDAKKASQMVGVTKEDFIEELKRYKKHMEELRRSIDLR